MRYEPPKANGEGGGIRVEADPRHAELLIASLGPKAKAGISTPGVKLRRGKGTRFEEEALEETSGAPTTNVNPEDVEDEPVDDTELPESTARLYRAGAARANYLALDRADLSWAGKELCRRMAAPRREDLLRLRRLARYLLSAPRLVAFLPFQDEVSEVKVFVDTDFAGCPDTRRSTSCGCMMMGRHLLKHWSTTQKTITLSSGEAELSGCVKGAAEGLGLVALLRDLGVDGLNLQLWTDSSAALGIMKRSGIGKIRHLSVALLWVQERVRCGDITVWKVDGDQNPADIFTKAVPRTLLNKHLAELGLSLETGRAASAPQVTAKVEAFLV